ncbi:hypothetical protein [Bacteroides acidifaciens]|uniref:hypothetical protein n=1 Tax=Bacteroides acidifaciens TaxID=85831 RepID=UPI003F6936B0
MNNSCFENTNDYNWLKKINSRLFSWIKPGTGDGWEWWNDASPYGPGEFVFRLITLGYYK